MKIGELARGAGVTVDTVRYYERLGLLEANGRTSGGFREFADDAPARLAEIRTLQSLGLTLDAIRELVRDGACTCGEARSALAAVDARIDAAIAALEAVKARSKQAALRCGDGDCRHGGDAVLTCT